MKEQPPPLCPCCHRPSPPLPLPRTTSWEEEEPLPEMSVTLMVVARGKLSLRIWVTLSSPSVCEANIRRVQRRGSCHRQRRGGPAERDMQPPQLGHCAAHRHLPPPHPTGPAGHGLSHLSSLGCRTNFPGVGLIVNNSLGLQRQGPKPNATDVWLCHDNARREMIMTPALQVRKLALSNMPTAGPTGKTQSRASTWPLPGSCAPLAQGAPAQALVGPKCHLPCRLGKYSRLSSGA